MPKKLGKYQLEQELGRGGMGTVYSAWDPQLERRVAIKLVAPFKPGSESSRQRFAREARAVARLKSPHVVQLYDYGIAEDGTPYAVMELLEGEDLRMRLKRTKTVPLRVLTDILVQVARGLDAAHQSGVIHRDLKPANVFLCRDGLRTIAKILDFGLATVNAQPDVPDMDELTNPHQIIGTPQYMSPEQARSEPTDHTTDLWSLAVLTYEALTGQRPFQAQSFGRTILRICTEPHPPPSSLSSAFSSELDEFFDRALAKASADRFASAGVMIAALQEIERQQDQRPLKILVVDDEPDAEVLMRQRFRKRRFDMLFATRGKQALDLLQDHPDTEIALVDLNMPEMDGHTLLRHLSTDAPMLRPIVVSAYGDMGNIRQAMNAGAFDFVVKPIDFKDLETTINKAAKEVRSLRNAMRSAEVGEVLAEYVDPRLQTKLIPLLQSSEASIVDQFEATAVCIRLNDSVPPPVGEATVDVERLNDAFDEVASALHSHGGFSIRFLDDRITALFDDDNHTVRALTACIQAREAVSKASLLEVPLEDKITRQVEPATPSPAPFPIGLETGRWHFHAGVAWGPVLMAKTGSASLHRYDQIALGEPVTLAHKLANLARDRSILVPRSMSEELPRIVRTAACEQVEQLAELADNVSEVISLASVVQSVSMAELTTTEHAFTK